MSRLERARFASVCRYLATYRERYGRYPDDLHEYDRARGAVPA